MAVRKTKGTTAVGTDVLGRVVPQAIDIERALLGALLIEKDAIAKVIDLLSPEAFYDPRHQRIYAAIRSLFDQGLPVDLISVQEVLRRNGELKEVGPYYLAELTLGVASSANAENYARIIVEKYLLRQIISLAGELTEKAFQEEVDAFELLDSAENRLYELSQHHLRRSVQSGQRVLQEALALLEKLRHKNQPLTGVPSGFPELDRMTAGWQKSDLIILAARPSMGKTAFALNLARHAAMSGYPVAIFSLEMSALQLMYRFISMEVEISSELLRTGKIPPDLWLVLPQKLERLSQAPIFIDDTPSITIYDLRAKCRRLKAEKDIQLVMIDYLQLMGTTQRAQNREQEIAAISRSLKALARELEVPIIALSQLSRAVETRGGDRRPQLSDLRESGSLEQDADVVLFLYRPEYYGIMQDEEGNPTQGITEVLLSKQRNGPIGKVRLRFISDYMRFLSLEPSLLPNDSGGFTLSSRANDLPPPSDDDEPFPPF
ncbi:MAG: replicative DNA helicase [Bacteroidia bacterium]|nr:replicative DNA helicase [Bacteroidia bacterium]MCX7763786.1 replicative DNA helicase [Bacteroidia bacterium]MDW8056915.1 replicative DNA helicase [Bacteroidia bacterium]